APADGDNVISVGAVTSSGAVWFKSSRGPTPDGRIKPDLMARGVSTASATGATDSSFGFDSGTSLSTPLVAGAAALVIEARPDWTALEVLEALRNTASNSDFPNNDIGWGIVDVMAAINYSVGGDSDTTSLEGLTMGNIYPNPSHIGVSNILVNIPEDEEYKDGVDYSLIIYNVLGEKVWSVHRRFVLRNTYNIPWDHKNDKGEFAASGIYFAVLIVEGKTISRKFAVLH
ncbi:MAG: S8 family peptidase, partial [Candidatus Marinimicrobia bacterium]|nr:S8 family peptidase [Candidatus Neomarinimicrobiota bacterium]